MSIGGNATIQQCRDLRVFEIRQDLPFATESSNGRFADALRAKELDGHALLELVVIAHGLVHRAHAADANATRDLVDVDALADPSIRFHFDAERRCDRTLQFAAGELVGIRQTAYAHFHVGVLRPELLPVRFARRIVEFERVLEAGLHERETLCVQRDIRHDRWSRESAA